MEETMKIGLFCVYFGSFPKYFPLFLLSAKRNSNFKFYIYTDNAEVWDLPENVEIIKCSFSDIKRRLQSLFQFPINLQNPYKLNDYKPVYGQLFLDKLSAHTHWGYFDIDIILGDLDLFATNEDLQKYDKIGSRGHLTIFKNTPQNRLAYLNDTTSKSFTFKEAFTTGAALHFDEMWGINEIYQRLEYSYKDESAMRDNSYYDASPKYFALKAVNLLEQNVPTIFTWNEGDLVARSEGLKKKFGYIHLQKRPMTIEIDNSDVESFFISQDGFVQQEITEQRIETLLHGQSNVWPDGNVKHLAKYFFKTIVSGEQFAKIKRKMKK